MNNFSLKLWTIFLWTVWTIFLWTVWTNLMKSVDSGHTVCRHKSNLKSRLSQSGTTRVYIYILLCVHALHVHTIRTHDLITINQHRIPTQYVVRGLNVVRCSIWTYIERIYTAFDQKMEDLNRFWPINWRI